MYFINVLQQNLKKSTSEKFSAIALEQYPGTKLLQVKVSDKWKEKLSKVVETEALAKIEAELQIVDSDVLFLAFGEKSDSVSKCKLFL